MVEAQKQDTSALGVEPYRLVGDEEYMSPRQEDHFREILLAWKAA